MVLLAAVDPPGSGWKPCLITWDRWRLGRAGFNPGTAAAEVVELKLLLQDLQEHAGAAPLRRNSTSSTR